MENSRLLRNFLLSKPEIGWKRSRGGQVMTWHRGTKEATREVAAVGQCRLPGWGPRDSAHKWLSTLEDMARDRCQWRSCCNFLIDLHHSKLSLTLELLQPLSPTVKEPPFSSTFSSFLFPHLTHSKGKTRTNKRN